jgi:hypothetical protein
VGYDLHITCADEWSDSSAAPISPTEWATAAGELAGLRVAGSVTTSGSDVPVYVLDEDGPSLIYQSGRIVVSGVRDEDDVKRVVDIASALGARVVGDDGEEYGADGQPIPD